jgi:hypothetical protein
MKTCLSERSLILLHSGDGTEADRIHIETCLSCARQYRELSVALESIVTVLKQPPPAAAHRGRWAYPRWGWSLAAAAIVLAFVCGRLTAFGVASPVGVNLESVDHDSADPGDTTTEWQEANNAGTPASYGLYIDGLLSQDEPDQNAAVAEGSAEGNGEADSDEN